MKQLEIIKRTILKYYGLPYDYIDTKLRYRDIISKKYLIAYFMREKTNKSLAEIGRYLNINHATVLYAHRQITNYLSYDKDLQKEVKEINKLIKKTVDLRPEKIIEFHKGYTVTTYFGRFLK